MYVPSIARNILIQKKDLLLIWNSYLFGCVLCFHFRDLAALNQMPTHVATLPPPSSCPLSSATTWSPWWLVSQTGRRQHEKSFGSSVGRPVHGPPQPWPHSSSKTRWVAPPRHRVEPGNVFLCPQNSLPSVESRWVEWEEGIQLRHQRTLVFNHYSWDSGPRYTVFLFVKKP